MTWVTLAVMAGSALVGAEASRKAGSTQANAARRAEDLQREMFERQVELQEPWRQAGLTALNKLIPLATEYTPFGMEQFQADPGYAFRMAEGMKALERSAAARGGLLSGGALKATQRFGQDLASQEYTNAFNRYQAERSARLAPLQSLAGVGQTSAQQIAGQAGQMGANVGNLMQAGAAARASGYMGQANALMQGLGSYMNYQQGQNMMNMLQNQGYRGASPSYGGGMAPVNYSLAGSGAKF
jgi:hypothetical protein